MIIHNCEQGTQEWLNLRLGKLTGTAAYTISVGGKGLDTLCEELAWERIVGEKEESYKNEAMQRGIEMEQMAADAYELQFGVDVHKIGFAEHNEYIGISPDRLIGKDSGLEIKSKLDKGHRQLLLGKVEFEPQYLWQCYMAMLILDRQSWNLISFNPNFGKSSIFRLELLRDNEHDDKLLSGFEKGEKLIREYEEKFRNFIN